MIESLPKAQLNPKDLGTLIPEVPADAILAALFGNNIYAIGGRIRDALVAHYHHRSATVPKDLDYVVTGVKLEAVVVALEAAGAKVDAVGASFAVLKVRIGDVTLDLALPRRERSTGPGHRDFAVDFGPEVSIVDDALRRDFTINALCMNLTDRRIIAPDRAIEDLRDGVIRAISDTSFDDDPLRMLRAAQFASRLEFAIDPRSLAQISE
jgi:tRNA nucleotidyltransferase (CCA-adding enzyme)